MYPKQEEHTPNRHQGYKHNRTKWLDQLLETRYQELFGDDHLAEDIPLVNQLNQENNNQINVLQATTLPIDKQYERAMAEYQREKEAEITKYNFQVAMDFPLTLQCQPIVSTPSEVSAMTDETIEMTISPQEEMEIIGESREPEVGVQGESRRQQKRKSWAYRRKLKHQARKKKE